MKKLLPIIFFSCSIILTAQEETTPETTVKDPMKWVLDTSGLSKKDPITINFVGSGNIQKSFESGEEIPATTGLGVYFTKHFPHFKQKKTFAGMYRVDMEANINIASTLDTISANGLKDMAGAMTVANISDFGRSILTPLNSGEAVNLEIRGYFIKPAFGLISGVRVHYTGSNRNWQVTDGDADTVMQATTNMARIGVFHEFIPFENREDYSITLGFAYAYNSVQGDVGLDDNKEIRALFLGTEEKRFKGWEVGLGLRLKNIRADFAYTIFNKNLPDISGLTGNRLVTTIRFVGGFGLDLGKKE